MAGDAHKDFAALVQRIVDQRLRERVSAVESACFMALLDQAGRGVLVVDHDDGSYEVTLDESVPAFNIHYRRVP